MTKKPENIITYKVEQLDCYEDIKNSISEAGYKLCEVNLKTYLDAQDSFVMILILDDITIDLCVSGEESDEIFIEKIKTTLSNNPKKIYNAKIDTELQEFGLF